MDTILTTAICLNSKTTTTKPGEIIKPIVIMKTGVYNSYLKTSSELEQSAKWWNVPIVIKSRTSTEDHPDSVIVTNTTLRVGQISNARWDADNNRLIGDAIIYEDLCPDWLMTAIKNGEVKGVSGTYFCDLKAHVGIEGGKEFTHDELHYAPNNVAIVDHPACTPEQGCGLNMNSQKVEEMEVKEEHEAVVERADDVEIVVEEKIIIVENKEGENMVEITVEDMQKQLDEMGIQMNSVTDKLAKATEALTAASEKIAVYETKEKETAFLAQFPEASRELAKAELLATFMKDPRELIMNHAVRLGELLVPAVVEDKSVGSEHVDIPITLVENEDRTMPPLPDMDRVRGLVKGRVVA